MGRGGSKGVYNGFVSSMAARSTWREIIVSFAYVAQAFSSSFFISAVKIDLQVNYQGWRI
jgi:hypothetical protein